MPSSSQHSRQRKWHAAARKITRTRISVLPPVMFLTDETRTPNPLATVQRLPKGWGVLYRHFGGTDSMTSGRELANCARQRGLFFSVSSDISLARKLGADGIHIPNSRLPNTRRSSLGDFVITTSVHSPSELRRAIRFGVNSLFVSPIFESLSPSAGKSLNIFGLRGYIQKTNVDIFGLGGISASNCQRLNTSLAAVEALQTDFESKI